MSRSHKKTRVSCPYCGDDVTKGIKKWRGRVHGAYAHHGALKERVREWIDGDFTSHAVPEEQRHHEYYGLDFSLSLSATELNRIVSSHHPHVSFIAQERDGGHIPRDIHC